MTIYKNKQQKIGSPFQSPSLGHGASDRMAFKIYALQRLHAANFRGVAAVINSRLVIRTGPGVPPGCGLQPLGTARPEPAINFRSLRGIARQAITTTTNNNNFAAARLTPGTQGARMLLSYCLSSPVQSLGGRVCINPWGEMECSSPCSEGKQAPRDGSAPFGSQACGCRERA